MISIYNPRNVDITMPHKLGVFELKAKGTGIYKEEVAQNFMRTWKFLREVETPVEEVEKVKEEVEEVEEVATEGRKLHPFAQKALEENGIAPEEAKAMSLEELVALKGIGEKTAKDILAL